MKTLDEFLKEIFPVMVAHTVDRVDKTVEEGKVSIYWVKDVLRIDIKFAPKPNSEEEF